MSKSRSKTAKFVRISLYVLAVFLFQEMVLRICFPLPEIRNLDRADYLNPGEHGGAYTRNQSRTWQSVLDTSAVFTHSMNRYGFRGAEWSTAKTAGKKRILFIGDSFVEGVMASDAETLPNGFLQEAGESQTEVFNAGILGKGLDTYLQAAADLIPVFQPDHVFLVIYANDLKQSAPKVPPFFLEPESFKWYNPRFLDLLQERNEQGAVRAIWQGGSRPYLTAVPDPSNPWTENEAQLAPSVSRRIAEAMKKGQFNPFRTNSLAKEARYLSQAPQLGELLPFFKYVCNQNQAQPWVVYIPSRHQVSSYYLPYDKEMCRVDCPDSLDLSGPAFQIHAEALQRQCRQFQMPFTDLSPLIRKKEAQGKHLYWNYDEHMRGEGYLFLGKEIARAWKANKR